MNEELGFGVEAPLEADVLRIDAGVYLTLAHPDVNVLAPRQAPDVRAEEHVRQEQNLFVGGYRVDDFDGVARRAAIIALGFHLGRRIDVRHDDGARVLGFPAAQRRSVDG